MTRGIKKHLKRLYAPSHWMLDKLTGVWAPKPIAGPHKLRESLPLIVLLRNRLKYALTHREAKMITMQRLIKVDGKVRTDMRFPTGFMDVVSIDKTKENFRLLYDTKGRFVVHKIHRDEATYKLLRVNQCTKTTGNIPIIVTHDGRTIRFPDPEVKVNDTVRFDFTTGKMLDYLKFDVGNFAMISSGNNIGRIGRIHHREKHPGTFEIIHMKDEQGHAFATRLQNVTVIGDKNKAWVSLPKGEGIKLTNMEDRAIRMEKHKTT
jgi:small subunit ribosomal protein S4e